MGFRLFWVTCSVIGGGHLQAKTSNVVFDWCRKEKISCLYFLADGTDSQTLEYAYNAGFKFVDVRVEMELDLRNLQQTEAPSLEIKPVTKNSELSSIFSFARKAYTDSRFFKDLNFDRIKCEKLYEKWIYRDFDKRKYFGFLSE